VVAGPVLVTLPSATPISFSSIRPTIWSANTRPVLEVLGENPPAVAVVQHSVRQALGDVCGVLRRTRIVRQGDNALSFYAADAVLV